MFSTRTRPNPSRQEVQILGQEQTPWGYFLKGTLSSTEWWCWWGALGMFFATRETEVKGLPL